MASPLQFAAQGRKSNWPAPLRPPEGDRVWELVFPASVPQVKAPAGMAMASPLRLAVKGRKSNWPAPLRPPEGERVLELALLASAPQVKALAGMAAAVPQAKAPAGMAQRMVPPLVVLTAAFLLFPFLAHFSLPRACS